MFSGYCLHANNRREQCCQCDLKNENIVQTRVLSRWPIAMIARGEHNTNNLGVRSDFNGWPAAAPFQCNCSTLFVE